MIKLFHLGVQVNTAETTHYMYTGMEQLSKCRENGGSQFSHCWGRRLQKNKKTGISDEALELEIVI